MCQVAILEAGVGHHKAKMTGALERSLIVNVIGELIVYLPALSAQY